jgi:serine/threonine-protein kinase
VPYLVMELVEGRDLETMLAAGAVQVGQAVGIAAQVCDALAVAHQAGLVHRDIKPGNILLTPAGVVKVCDFGVAAAQQPTRERAGRHAQIIGTSGYMAPEQATGWPVDARADLYGLGCVLYAMLTGGPPFAGDDPADVAWLQVNEPPVPLAVRRPDAPAELAALVDELLAKDPADRPQTAAQVRQRLQRVSDQIAGAVPVRAAAAGSMGGASARASVVNRTQSMPVLDPAVEPVPDGRGWRVGPAGVAAVAVGVAAVTALAVAVLFAMRPAGPTGLAAGPGITATASGPASTVAPTDAGAGTVDAIRASIQAQVLAGNLDVNTANDLADKLDEVERHLAKDQTGKAADKAADLQKELAELRDDGKISQAVYDAVLPGLDQLIAGLPPTDDRDD